MGYSWPGNVRQLENVVEQSAILDDGPVLHVAPELLANAEVPDYTSASIEELFASLPTLEELKKRYIAYLLQRTHGNITRTAAMLNVNRRSLYRMVDRERIHTAREMTPDSH